MQKLNSKTQQIRAVKELKKGWKDVNKILHY